MAAYEEPLAPSRALPVRSELRCDRCSTSCLHALNIYSTVELRGFAARHAGTIDLCPGCTERRAS